MGLIDYKAAHLVKVYPCNAGAWQFECVVKFPSPNVSPAAFPWCDLVSVRYRRG